MRRRGVTRAALPQLQEIMGCANSKRAAGAGNGCDSEEKWRSKTRRGIRGQRSALQILESANQRDFNGTNEQGLIPSLVTHQRHAYYQPPVSCGHAAKPLSSSYLVLARKLLISESEGF
jgi:hypothetical protein